MKSESEREKLLLGMLSRKQKTIDELRDRVDELERFIKQLAKSLDILIKR